MNSHTQVPAGSPTVIVPMITPMRPGGDPDLDSLANLIEYLLDAGVDGLLALGSSAECVAIPAPSRRRIAAFVLDRAADRTSVMIGVPAWGTGDALLEAADLCDAGATQLLVCAPAGMRLAPSELRRHFEAFADLDAEIIAYDVPGRVGNALDPATIRALAQDGSIAGLKDSSGDLVKARRYADAVRDLPGFSLVTGCEEAIDASLLVGYTGCVPGLANVFPQLHVALARAAGRGDWLAAADIQRDIVGLLDLYDSPVPDGGFLAQFFGSVKEALRQRGVIASAAASPVLAPADQSLERAVTALLERADAVSAARAVR
ncbi:UNVERIFIED_CONTAM: dihydrodipicolinate synthase family protein [Microbacterium sp. SLM126]